jgi:flagellar export protein FliJ
MAFRYKLESILRLRYGIERQEEQRLYAIASTVARLRAEIARLEASRLAQKRSMLEELKYGASGAVLQFMALCDGASEERLKRLLRTLKECEEKRLEQLAVYQNAKQKREILKGLRDRQQYSYELECARHTQQDADEAFLFRGCFSKED